MKADENTAESEADEEEEEKPKKKKSSERKKPEKKVKKTVKNNDTDSSESETFTIRKTTSDSKGVFAALKLKIDEGWKKVRCQMDTGSSCNLIGLNDLKKLVKDPEIRETKSKIQDIQQNSIESIGECEIPGIRNGRKFRLIFQVVHLDHHPLLSENACRVLDLVKYSKKERIVEQQKKPGPKENNDRKIEKEGKGKSVEKLMKKIDELTKEKDKAMSELKKLRKQLTIQKRQELVDWKNNESKKNRQRKDSQRHISLFDNTFNNSSSNQEEFMKTPLKIRYSSTESNADDRDTFKLSSSTVKRPVPMQKIVEPQPAAFR
jgi:hypothetical protein